MCFLVRPLRGFLFLFEQRAIKEILNVLTLICRKSAVIHQIFYLRSLPALLCLFSFHSLQPFGFKQLKQKQNSSQVPLKTCSPLSLDHVVVCFCMRVHCGRSHTHTHTVQLPASLTTSRQTKKIFSKPTSGTDGEMIKFSMQGVQKQ